MKRYICIVVVTLFSIIARGQKENTFNQLRENSISYTVKVKSINNKLMGTGFLLGDSTICLVTAKHVLMNTASGKFISPIVELEVKDSQDMNIVYPFILDLSKLRKQNLIKTGNDQEDWIVITLIKRKEDKSVTPDGVTVIKSFNQTVNLSKMGLGMIKKLTETRAGDDVFFIGYPSINVADSLGSITASRLDQSLPLMSKGIIAGYIESRNKIIISCVVYPGNSGGPVIAEYFDGRKWKIRVIGIATELTVYYGRGIKDNSSYAIVEPLDEVVNAIMELSNGE